MGAVPIFRISQNAVVTVGRSLTRLSLFRGEFGERFLQSLAAGMAVQHEDPVAENHRRAWLQRERDGLLLRIVALPSERVGGKQAVASGVPVGRMAVVGRMVEDDDRHGSPSIVPLSAIQGPRVPHTASPSVPSLAR